MPIVLGCDLSLTGTGLVVIDGETVLTRHLVQSDADSGTKESRINHVIEVMYELIGEYRPSAVGIEGYAFGKQFGGENLAELGGVVKHYLYIERINFDLVAPKALQKFALGYGGYKRAEAKPLMIEAARAHGCRTYDDNIADAFWAARWRAGLPPHVG